jgi:glutathione synthase/RimK-type ligase-like ATP-grasp enzyme
MLSGCSHIVIHDAEWCSNLPDGGAYCAHTLTPENRELSREEWDKMRVGKVCTDAKTLGDIKKVIQQLCSQTNNCYIDNQRKVLVINLNDK